MKGPDLAGGSGATTAQRRGPVGRAGAAVHGGRARQVRRVWYQRCHAYTVPRSWRRSHDLAEKIQNICCTFADRTAFQDVNIACYVDRCTNRPSSRNLAHEPSSAIDQLRCRWGRARKTMASGLAEARVPSPFRLRSLASVVAYFRIPVLNLTPSPGALVYVRNERQ